MAANIITIGRVVLAFIAIAFFSMGFYFAIIAVFLTILVIYLDSLDGYVARKLGVASEFGALLAILVTVSWRISTGFILPLSWRFRSGSP